MTAIADFFKTELKGADLPGELLAGELLSMRVDRQSCRDRKSVV